MNFTSLKSLIALALFAFSAFPTYSQYEHTVFGKSNNIELSKTEAVYSLKFINILDNSWFAIEFQEGYGHFETILKYSLKAIAEKPKDGFIMELGQWYFQIENKGNEIYYTGILKTNTDFRVRTPVLNKDEVLQLFGINNNATRI